MLDHSLKRFPEHGEQCFRLHGLVPVAREFDHPPHLILDALVAAAIPGRPCPQLVLNTHGVFHLDACRPVARIADGLR